MAVMKNKLNENIEELKITLKKDLQVIMAKLHIDDFDFHKYMEEVNDKLVKFREEVLENVITINISLIRRKWNG
jgi:hypothetical protein